MAEKNTCETCKYWELCNTRDSSLLVRACTNETRLSNDLMVCEVFEDAYPGLPPNFGCIFHEKKGGFFHNSKPLTSNDVEGGLGKYPIKENNAESFRG